MTRYIKGDEEKTLNLLQQQGEDSSWLRHTGLAGELDRRLLLGATEVELAEVRASWRRHVDHLRGVHNVRVERDPNGVWRIAGIEQNQVQALAGQQPATDADEAPDPDCEDVLNGEGLHDDQALDRIAITARALAALASAGLIASVLVKASVGMLIRQASESNHWHNCAHFRSHAARQLIQAAGIPSAASYQAFCTRNLRHEHVVPNSVIYRMLCDLEDRSAERIEELLRKFCIRATITRQEDALLGQHGLASAMPQAFYVPGDDLHMDPLARYRVIGLRESLEARATPRWFM